MKKYKIAIFFNNLRGLNVYNYLKKSKKFDLEIYLSKKNLNRKIIKKIPKKYKIIKNYDPKIISYIKKKNYFLNITAGWPLVLPEKAINLSKHGTINLHAGKLPEYRGGSPLNWQIIEGNRNIYISIIKMTKGLDTGPVFIQKKINLKDYENINDLHKKVNKIYPVITKKVIEDILKGNSPIKQSNKNIRCFKQRNQYDGKIDWHKMSANKVFNMVRALARPYPGAFYEYNKKKIRINKCKKSLINNNLKPGRIFYLKKNKYIKCSKNSIKILDEEKMIFI